MQYELRLSIKWLLKNVNWIVTEVIHEWNLDMSFRLIDAFAVVVKLKVKHFAQKLSLLT